MAFAVKLSERDWEFVLGCVARAPWFEANPRLTVMSAQIEAQKRVEEEVARRSAEQIPEPE